MDWNTVLTAAITTLGVIAVGVLGYLGIRHQVDASKAANAEQREADQEATNTAEEQKRFREAWPELLDSVREELVEPLREELGRERAARQELARTVEAQGKQISALSSEVHRWQQIARTLARWGLRLRDQVISLGDTIPTDPDELLHMRAIEDAQIADLPPS